MISTNRITAERPPIEHPGNGVEWGLNGVQDTVLAAQIVDELATGWTEAKRLDVVLLRAIARLSQKIPGRVCEGFDAWELATEIGNILGKRWAGDDPREMVSDKVRGQWNRLNDTWKKKNEGVHQSFQQRQLPFTAQPDRVEGGGQGNPTRYRILVSPLLSTDGSGVPVSAAEPSATGTAPCAPKERSRFRAEYICEDLEDASFFARIFSRGFELTGWRKILLRGVVLAALLSAMAAGEYFAWKLLDLPSLTKLTYMVFNLAMFCFMLWVTFGKLFVLPQWRIALAPWWMQSVDDDRLLEWRGPPRYEIKSLKAARYTAVCPLCGGKVVVSSGSFRFQWRLVGRCEEAPSAHVFSFDHVLREGQQIF
jgi:hypothetical protein